MYDPIVWKDDARVPQNLFSVTDNGDGTVTAVRAGRVIQQGTNMNAANFGRMDYGIFDAHLAEAYTAIRLRQQGWRMEELSAELTALAASGIGQTSIQMEIPASGWETLVGGAYPMRLDIPTEAAAESCTPILTILPESMGTAIGCGLCPVAETLGGKLRLYAQTVPASPMHCELTLVGTAPDIPGISGGGGGGGSGGGGSGGGGEGQTLPVASRTRLGVVRVGGGVNVTTEGEISVDAASYAQSPAVVEAVTGAATIAAASAVQTAVTEKTATEEEAADMLSDVFGNT